MTLLNILKQGNPVLKKKSKAVTKLTPKHTKLIKDMFETMKEAPGIGLAAPQVGALERIIVILLEGVPYCVVNPKISKKAGRQVCKEACLSVPGLEGPVERHKNITVKGLDRTGKPFQIDAEGLLAVVFQHEIDHLDGILFVDRVKDPSQIELINKEKKPTI